MVSRVGAQYSKNNATMDRVGMFLSALCLVHCVALPPLLAALPLVAVASLPEWLQETEWIHAALLLPVVL
ncbi:MAG: MerC family mercury resistance protein, partial [Planctomycetota bacterium]